MISTWAKYTYTAILCVNHMAFAMSVTAIGSILTEMVDILQTTTDKMTLFTTFTSTGYLIGSFFCFLLKYLNRQLVWIVYLVIMAITLALVPHSPNLTSLYGCAIGVGLGAGVLSTIINVWIIEMWREKSAAILQIPGLTFGVGTILTPLIIKPYLRHKYSSELHLPLTTVSMNVNSSSITSSTTYVAINSTQPYSGYNDEYEDMRRSLLKTPFYILGVIQLIFPILMTVMFAVKPYKYSDENFNSSPSNKQEDQEYKLFDRQRQQRKLMIILFSTLLATYNVHENMYYTFAPTYFQYSPLQLTETKAADMITAFTTPYTVFRGISCLIAVKVIPKYMLSAHYLINIVGIVCLVFAQNNMTVLWIANVIIGIGVSAIMQTSFAFVGQHIRMTDMIGTILIVFLGCFNIAPPYVIGLFIKDHSEVFIIVEACTLIICIVLFAILNLFIRKYERYDKMT